MRNLLFLLILFGAFNAFGESFEREAEKSKFIPITEKVAVITIQNSDTVIYRTVNIALGEVFVFEFPENISLTETPTVGDAGLLKIEVETEPLKMKVWGLMLNEAPEEALMYGLSSNVQFKINSGQAFIFNFVISPPEEASNRIIFSYPEWETSNKAVNKHLEMLRKELESKYEKRMREIKKEIDRSMVGMMAKSFSEFFQCSSYSARTEENLVFLRSDRICKIGKEALVTVNFSVKNRYRQRFHIESVKIYSTKGGKVEIDNAQYHIDKFSMQFDEIVSGGIAFKISDEDYSREYIIEVNESAGKKRKLELKVSF
ncbi:hypothetical protein J5681_06775 [bacterium]|nr:hypothetical protein [bacterium]